MKTLHKFCKGCNSEKPLTNFYKQKGTKDGLRGKCIECFKKQNSSWNKRNNWTEKTRKWERENREKYLEKHREQARKHREKYPIEVSVRILTANAIRLGKLKRKPCVVCSSEKAHAHHPSYSKPFDIIWLCAKHHYAVHHQKLTLQV